MQLTLADGQLAIAAASIYSGDARIITIVLQNTSASVTQTILLTFKRSGGTARRLTRQVLLANEQCIIKNLRIEPGDTLLGVTTTASVVDYLISAGDGGEFAITSFDANGAYKQVNGTSVSGAITGSALTTSGDIESTGGDVIASGDVSGATATISGAATAASVAVTGGLTSSGPTGTGIGYATGAGGTVTQGTSRSTGVTLSKLSGQITTHDASLAAGAEVTFTVTNTTVAATDVILLSMTAGGTGTPFAYVSSVGSGTFDVTLTNLHASTADTSADVINFAVIKAVAA